jgi:hypothetical protein
MPRRVQDIIPNNRRSIRDIPVARPDTRVERERVSADVERLAIHRVRASDPEPIDAPAPTVSNKQHSRRKGRSSARFPWALAAIGIIVAIAVSAYGLSGHFAKATFILAAKTESVDASGTYIIPSLSSASTNGIFGYETMTLNEDSSTTIPASIGAHTETKAQGSVTVYNAYSAQSQRIVAGSRLADDSGLIYRLTNSIVIPGFSVSGKTIIPGSVTATIVADNPGDQYNISGSDPVSDFQFVAYKGTPRYGSLYARLAGDVSGGFVGSKTVVAPSLLASTTAALEASIIRDLQARLSDTIPAGYVAYPNVFASAFTSPAVSSINASSARVSVSGTIYGAIFNANGLASFLAGPSIVSRFGGAHFEAPDISDLSVVSVNPTDFVPTNGSKLVIRVNGSFTLKGVVPVDALKQAFSGISLAKTADIIEKYSNVIDVPHSSAEMVPPWISTVPADEANISIIVK